MAGADPAAFATAAERGRIIGEGTNRTRHLSQRAANDVSPEVLADEAVALGRAHDLQVEVFGPEEASALAMGMFMAVGRGSDNPPRFIVMRSGAPGETDARGRLLAMIGKGVTFDSGGISLKPADHMEEMKTDKTGACTVINAIATVAALAPGLPLMAVAPAVENMPGPHSTRPAMGSSRSTHGRRDQNTGRRGRLILGDAMTWKPSPASAPHLVDVATLTGAVHRALGFPDLAASDATGVVGRVAEAGAPGRADLAAATSGRLPQGSRDLLRRAQQLLGRRTVRWSKRPLPARLRHGTVGPPRHRRLGLPSEGHPIHRSRRDRRDPRHARRAGLAWRLTAHVPGRRSA
jgi:leucyl aminopeptidase